jgi:hypothetical protein
MEKEFPSCFDSYDQYAKWRAEAVKERDADWEAHCSETGQDPDAVRSHSRRVYPIQFQIASICEDCSACYQKRMTAEGRCANPIEVIAKPTSFSGVSVFIEEEFLRGNT